MLTIAKTSVSPSLTVIVTATDTGNPTMTATLNELAAELALAHLDALLLEREDCIREGRPLRPIAIRIRWAKAEFKRCAALAGVKVAS